MKRVSHAFKASAPGSLAARRDSNTCTSIPRERRREENQHAGGKVGLQPDYTGVPLPLIMAAGCQSFAQPLQPSLLELILKGSPCACVWGGESPCFCEQQKLVDLGFNIAAFTFSSFNKSERNKVPLRWLRFHYSFSHIKSDISKISPKYN